MQNTSDNTKPDTVQLNVRANREHSTYARVVAAKTGRQLAKVIEESIELLHAKYGDL